MEEEEVVVKVRDLLETLDEVKKYNELARSLKKFILIVLGSVVALLGLRAIFVAIKLSEVLGRFDFVLASAALLVIPLLGILGGVLYVSRRVASVKKGEWEGKLQQGFPGALQILSELNWQQIADEISIGKLSYTLYGLVKIAAYWVVIFFALELLGDVLLLGLHVTILLAGVLWVFLSLLIIVLVFSDDLLRRYREVRALDMLLWELRWFSGEFERAEFQQA